MELRKRVTDYDLDEKTTNAIMQLEKQKSKKSEKPNIHKDHRSRLKKQFVEHGLESLSDVQKLEMLLFYSIPLKDTNPIAHALIDEFGTFKNVFHADFHDLMRVLGVKENSATLISFLNGMLNYCSRPDLEDIVGSSAKAKEYVSKYYFNIDVEQFYVFCLTKSNKIRKAVLINSGTIDEVDVQIRQITATAIEHKCNRIIISHNHPSGKAVMSEQDCRFTYSVICSCILNNIDVLDHIITGTDRTISLLEQGIIERLKSRANGTIQISKERKSFLAESTKNYIKSECDD